MTRAGARVDSVRLDEPLVADGRTTSSTGSGAVDSDAGPGQNPRRASVAELADALDLGSSSSRSVGSSPTARNGALSGAR